MSPMVNILWCQRIRFGAQSRLHCRNRRTNTSSNTRTKHQISLDGTHLLNRNLCRVLIQPADSALLPLLLRWQIIPTHPATVRKLTVRLILRRGFRDRNLASFCTSLEAVCMSTSSGFWFWWWGSEVTFVGGSPRSLLCNDDAKRDGSGWSDEFFLWMSVHSSLLSSSPRWGRRPTLRFSI